jgi:tryptophan halogenase
VSRSPDAVSRIVIVGGGATGWMAAAVLARALRGLAPVEIGVLELAGQDEPPAAATLPSIRRLHGFLELSEAKVMAAARGGYRLGVRFEGWNGPGSSRFLPFGEIGASLGSVGFHHLLLRLERQGRPHDAGDYALAALAARAGRFTLPLADPRSVLSTLECGLHLDTRRYGQVLRTHALAAGVKALGGALARASLDPQGMISALLLEDGRRIDGDFFVDCSGREGLLIAGALGVGEDDWTSWLPFDRVAQGLGRTGEAPEPFTRIIADEAGWLRRVPLQGASGIHYGYASSALDDDGAARRLGGADLRIGPAAFGRRKAAWSANCVALGEAAGSPGALPGVDLHPVQTGLQRLLSLFPFAGRNEAAIAEYNRLTAAESERLRDFALLQFRTNGRRGEPLWNACREGPLPDPLADKIRLYESRGRTPLIEEETFLESSWASVFLGQGVRARRYDALADAMPLPELEGTLARMRSAMSRAVEAMPTHAAYLAAHCPAPAAEIPS